MLLNIGNTCIVLIITFLCLSATSITFISRKPWTGLHIYFFGIFLGRFLYAGVEICFIILYSIFKRKCCIYWTSLFITEIGYIVNIGLISFTIVQIKENTGGWKVFQDVNGAFVGLVYAFYWFAACVYPHVKVKLWRSDTMNEVEKSKTKEMFTEEDILFDVE